MKISRFYQEGHFEIGQEYDLSQVNHRHAVQVLRLKINEPLIMFNGEGGEYTARLLHVDKRQSSLLIESFNNVSRESPLQSTLLLATIKPEKMDYALQKAVELGVSTIQPLYTKRSVIKIKENRLPKKMQHWQGVIIAACEQSGRTKLPELREPQSIEQCVKQYATGCYCLAMLPGANRKLADLNKRDIAGGIGLMVGPEGGFTPDEETLMRESGVEPINLGCRILRAETAVVTGLTACQLQWGDL